MDAADHIRRAVHPVFRQVIRLSNNTELKTLYDPQANRERKDNLATSAIMAAILRSTSNAIDIGANKGDVLQKIVELAPHGRHFAFEPIPALADSLRQRFPQVDVHQCALADSPGSSEFTLFVDDPAYSGLRARPDAPPSRKERLTVEVRRLDDSVPEDYAPVYVKIDVEGAEVRTLTGAERILTEHRPVLVLEHGRKSAALYGDASEALWDLLDAHRYRVYGVNGKGPHDRARFCAGFEPPEWNWLAVPAS